MILKTAITFKNKKNETLRGVLSCPDHENDSGRKGLIVFPNCGLMGAEGDFRSHYRIAEHLVKNGYHVLRFSPAGLGLSDGLIDACRTKDLFGSIESGLFVEDIDAAVRYMSEYDQHQTITLVGVCGGGISSILAAASIEKVDHVIPISCPVILDSADAQYSSRLSKKKSKLVLSTYKEKLSSFKAWRRLMTFESDWSAIKSAIAGYFKKDISYVENGKQNGFLYNPAFHNAINKIISDKKKCLFIYGGLDHFYFEFEGLFLNKYYKNNKNNPFDWYLIHDGNHMLSWVEMQTRAAKKINKWIGCQVK